MIRLENLTKIFALSGRRKVVASADWRSTVPGGSGCPLASRKVRPAERDLDAALEAMEWFAEVITICDPPTDSCGPSR